MVDNNIDLTATFDTSKATKDIQKFGDTADKSIDGVNESVDKLQKNISDTSRQNIALNTSPAIKAIDALKAGVIAAGAAIAANFTFEAIKGFFSSIVTESIDAENNLNAMNAALQRAGTYSEESSQAMQDFAGALMSVSTADDDVILGQIAIARNFTKTDEQARKLVEAALNLSAATGDDLNTSVEQLARTLDGTAGRLNETVPSLRGVTEEALKAGAAIDIVGQQFAGAARSKLDTFQGAVLSTRNSLGNLFAAMGDYITKNPLVIASVREASNAFVKATESVSGNRGSITDLVNNGIIALISGIRTALPILSVFNYAWDLLKWSIDFIITSFKNLTDALGIVFDVVKAGGKIIGIFSDDVGDLGDNIKKRFDGIIKRTDELGQSFSNIVKPDIFSRLTELDQTLARIQEAGNAKPVDIGVKIKPTEVDWKAISKPEKEEVTKKESILDNMAPIFQDWQLEIMNLNDDLMNGLDEMNTLSGATNALVSNAYTYVLTATKGVDGLIAEVGAAFARWSNQLIQGAAQGAEGASKIVPSILGQLTSSVTELLGSVFGAAGGQIGKAIGGIFSELINLSVGDKKEIEAKINMFFEAIPKVIDGIIANLPMVAERIFSNLPNTLILLFEALPKIFMAIAEGMDELAYSLAMNSPALAQIAIELPFRIIEASIVAVVNIVKGAALGFSRLAEEKLAAAFKVLNEKMFAAISKVSNFFDSIKEFFQKISISEIGAGVKQAINNLLDGAKNFFKKLQDEFSLDINFDFGPIFEEVKKGIGRIFSVDNIGKMVGELIGGIKKIFSKDTIDRLVQEIIDGIKSIFNVSLGKKSDGGKGPVEKAIGIDIPYVGFKTGGIVPKGFPNDTFPAMLSSNEVVVPTNTSDNLFSLIDAMAKGDNPNGSNNSETNALLRQLIAILSNQEKSIEVKLERDTLAKAILSLNKDNRRLA